MRSATAEGYLIGSDVGSGSCKTLLATTSGAIVARATVAYQPILPRPGWVEYRPEDWYDAFCRSVRCVLANAGVRPDAVRMVSIVGITHDPVLLDASWQVLRPAIHFNDARCAPFAQHLHEACGPRILERTLNRMSPLWTWPQLEWIKRHEPEVWRRIAAIVFPKDYVRSRLTGHVEPATDFIDAVGTLLFDPVRHVWIDEFVAALGLDLGTLPAVSHPLDSGGRVGEAGARDTGLAAGTCVVIGTTDTAAELLSAGAVAEGQGTLKLASVGRIAVVAARPLVHRHILNYPHLITGLWYPGTATKFAASAYRWLRECIWHDVPDNDFESMDRSAAGVAAGSEGLLFLPHLMGQSAPFWDTEMTGAFLGVGLHHHRAHYTRAVLEGVAFALRDAYEAVRGMGLEMAQAVLIGDGARSPLWRSIVASVMNRPLIVPVERDAAYGAVIIAAMALGSIGRHPAELHHLVQVDEVCEPDARDAEHYADMYGLYRRANEANRELTVSLHRFATSTFDHRARAVSGEVVGSASPA